MSYVRHFSGRISMAFWHQATVVPALVDVLQAGEKLTRHFFLHLVFQLDSWFVKDSVGETCWPRVGCWVGAHGQCATEPADRCR